MQKLLDYQVTHVETLKQVITARRRALDASDTGTGKTYTAVALCLELGLKPLIVCPVAVIHSWRTVLEYFEAPYYGITNYESMHNCKYFRPKATDKTKCPFIQRLSVENTKVNQESYATKEIEIFEKGEKSLHTYRWRRIPDDFVLIFDEAHRCKNPRTLNSVLLYTASRVEDMRILMLSATICDKPEKFAIAGYVLGLYKPVKRAKNWIEKIDEGHSHSMQGVHAAIFNDHGSRMRIKDLGALFPDNKITADCFDMDNAQEIEEQYRIIEEEVARLKNKEDNSGCALSRILYARMRIEQLKVPTIIKHAKQHIEAGASVAVFVNFTMTLRTVAEELKTTCMIWGEQTPLEREQNIEKFKTDKETIIVCNIRSGGVGISLHDTIGDRRRVALISPSDSAQDIIQTLGRIHRANGKTKVEQFVLYCKGTVEERVCENMRDKIRNISAINDGAIDTYKIEGLMDDVEAEEEPQTELGFTLSRFFTLQARKQRLEEDLTSINTELQSLQAIIQMLQ